ncbi:hypothetical protein FRB99_006654 [Tulasnella sp. 403]|nr:hypothetical protein FRB99_006654 [Tulasnella sp. 403]
MPLQLPVEIIGRIIQLVYDSQPKRSAKPLLPLLRVSPTFRVEVERILYSTLYLKSSAQVVKCFTTICKRPHLPRTVRTLTVSLHLNSQVPPIDFWDFLLHPTASQSSTKERRFRHTGRVLRAFALLVTRTLGTLTNLQDYSLSMGGHPGRDEVHFASIWLPANAPFRLRRFIVDLNLSPVMMAFLASQTSIVDLLAPSFTSDRLPFSKDLLPKLRGLVATSPVGASLAAGRPIRRVVLKDKPRSDTLTPLLNAIPELSKSTSTIKSFDGLVPDVTAVPGAIWTPLFTHLPDLENITFRRMFLTSEDEYALYTSEEFCQPLSEFRNLKFLALPAPPPFTHLREAGVISELDDLANAPPLAIHANINAQIVHGVPPPNGQPGGHPPIFGPPPPPGHPQNAGGGTFHFNFQHGPGAQGAPPPGPPPLVPDPAPAGAAQALPGLPPFLQQLFGFPPPANANQPGPPQANAGPPPPGGAAAENPIAPQGAINFSQTFVIQGNAAIPVNPGPPGEMPGGPAPPPNGGIPVPLNPGGPNGPQQAPPAPFAGLINIGNQIAAATANMLNLFDQMHGNNPGNPTGNDPDAAAEVPANPEGLDNAGGPQGLFDAAGDPAGMPATMFFPMHIPGLGPAPPGGAGPPPPPGGNPDGEPLQFNTTVFSLVDPITGAAIDEEAPPRKPAPDPKREEVIEVGRRNLRDKELEILDKWKLGGYAPNLVSVHFDMDAKRRTVWTWKQQASMTPAPAPSSSENDNSATAETTETNRPGLDGHWEVEYITRQ